MAKAKANYLMVSGKQWLATCKIEREAFALLMTEANESISTTHPLIRTLLQ